MEESRKSRVRFVVDVPEDLFVRVAQIAGNHELPITELVLIWMEAQVSPGADVAIGKAHS